uniref:Uncharacterized protein n=1 Tax=Ditylenchus dipsaci TaxID=166011 RepID=A0A915EN83_9BILA
MPRKKQRNIFPSPPLVDQNLVALQGITVTAFLPNTLALHVYNKNLGAYIWSCIKSRSKWEKCRPYADFANPDQFELYASLVQKIFDELLMRLSKKMLRNHRYVGESSRSNPFWTDNTASRRSKRFVVDPISIGMGIFITGMFPSLLATHSYDKNVGSWAWSCIKTWSQAFVGDYKTCDSHSHFNDNTHFEEYKQYVNRLINLVVEKLPLDQHRPALQNIKSMLDAELNSQAVAATPEKLTIVYGLKDSLTEMVLEVYGKEVDNIIAAKQTSKDGLQLQYNSKTQNSDYSTRLKSKGISLSNQIKELKFGGESKKVIFSRRTSQKNIFSRGPVHRRHESHGGDYVAYRKLHSQETKRR